MTITINVKDVEKAQKDDTKDIKVLVERIKDTDDVPLTINVERDGDIKINR